MDSLGERLRCSTSARGAAGGRGGPACGFRRAPRRREPSPSTASVQPVVICRLLPAGRSLQPPMAEFARARHPVAGNRLMPEATTDLEAALPERPRPSLVDSLIPVGALVVLLALSYYLFGASASAGPNQVALVFCGLVAAGIGSTACRSRASVRLRSTASGAVCRRSSSCSRSAR